ncbi:ribosomal protein L11 methyltransferase-domain-containing protein, partial [Pavlovales sp. CCMP2436]
MADRRIAALVLCLLPGTRSFAPVRCGRLWVAPAKCAELPPHGVVEVRLEVDDFTFLATAETTPRLHTTTRSMLEWLEQRAPIGRGTCLDYGCGSGILGIAALRLGVAAEAILTDIHEGAVDCAGANAARNGLADRCAAVTNLPAIVPPVPNADLCVANMLAGPLCSVALDIAGRVRDGADIGLTGFRRSELASVIYAYGPYFELDIEGAVEREGWLRLSGIRRAALVSIDSLSDSAVM